MVRQEQFLGSKVVRQPKRNGVLTASDGIVDFKESPTLEIPSVLKVTLRKGANVTQTTSITTAVTSDAYSGIITTFPATTASNAAEQFTVNNNKVRPDTKIVLSVVGYAGTAATTIPVVYVRSQAIGSFVVSLGNAGSAALDAAVQIHYRLL